MNILAVIFAAITNGFAALKAQVESNSAKLDQILSILNEVPTTNVIAGAKIGPWEVKSMAKAKAIHSATVGDFQLQDDGTATAPIILTDSVGEPAVLQPGATVTTTLVASDPDVVPTIDSTGLVVSIAVSLVTPPPALPINGITVTGTVNGSNPDGTTFGPFTAVSGPIDLNAGGPAGAQFGPFA
jgi:hypothetical protein